MSCYRVKCTHECQSLPVRIHGGPQWCHVCRPQWCHVCRPRRCKCTSGVLEINLCHLLFFSLGLQSVKGAWPPLRSSSTCLSGATVVPCLSTKSHELTETPGNSYSDRSPWQVASENRSCTMLKADSQPQQKADFGKLPA